MSRPVTPAGGAPPQTISRSNSRASGHAGARPASHVSGANTGIETTDHYAGAPHDTSALSNAGDVQDDGSYKDTGSVLQRSNSQMSQSQTMVPSRGGTLKKKASLKKTGSLKRSGSRKSSYAGSVRSMRLGEKEKYEPSEEHNSAFYCPVPITGSPTELLAERFQAWRKVLKDLIGYFRDLQKSYETRSKTVLSASNVMNNIANPPNFLKSGGVADANNILRDFHRLSISEANKSKELENEVVLQLTGLRSDLQQKIKEIKSLSGDFKNSVGKEQDGTRKAVRALQESLGHVDHDAASTSGKGDPFLVKLGVDRQLERQIEEENYLHRAYLNLEASGRELESIVVGEIQKAYNVLAGIMKREADHSYEAAEKLREGPIALPKDHEWDHFVTNNPHMVDPRMPLRQYGQITYAGKDHPAAIEVKSGMLERKSKYLKNYTPGWYVLSPTHLHEFKSADRIAFQSPVMSLYLPEQKLGTHSEPGSNSHKFILKGRQTGTMHRGHSWIFRAETHDTMLAWYNDIKELTEKRGEERNDFVRRTHARTLSSGSMKAPSIASGGSEAGMEEDEADVVPFSGEQSIRGQSVANENTTGGAPVGPARAYTGTSYDDGQSDADWRPQRPTPGGRFPSDLNVQRGLQAPLSPSSGDSFDENDRDAIAAAGALPGSGLPFVTGSSTRPHTDLQQSDSYTKANPYADHTQNRLGDDLAGAAGSANPGYVNPGNTSGNNNTTGYNAYTDDTSDTAGIGSYTAGDHKRVAPTVEGAVPIETASTYGEWMAPIGGGVAGAGAGAAAMHAYDNRRASNVQDQQNAIPSPGESSAPMMVDTAAPAEVSTEPRAMRESMYDSTVPAPTSSTQPISPMPSTTNDPEPHQGIGINSDPYIAFAPAQGKQAAAEQTRFGADAEPHPSRSSAVGAAPITKPGLGSAGTGSDSGIGNGMTGADYTSARPTLHHSAKSVQTISDLHVPGEFPKTPGL